jgi:chromosome segregation ATPase
MTMQGFSKKHIMTSIERLQQYQQDLEAQYDLLSGKLSRLRATRIIETDASTLFKLDTEIQAVERDLEKLKTELAETEQAIKAAEMSKFPSWEGQGQCHQLKLPSHFSSVCRFTYF